MRVVTGTPITGKGVKDATIPGKWAAPPAPAIITFNPRKWAVLAYSNILSGVRWAETIATSWGILNSSQTAIAAAIVGKSESLPIIIPTTGVELVDNNVEFKANYSS